MEHIDLVSEARRIIDLLISQYAVRNTFLCTNIKNGIKSKSFTVKDLGDYVPFFLYFGYNDYCRSHLADIISYSPSGLLPHQSKLMRVPVSSAYDHSDFVLGIMDYLDVESDPPVEARMLEVTKVIFDVYLRSPLPSSFYNHVLGKALPFFDTKDGMFIELFIDLFSKYSDDRYAGYAQSLFTSMVSCSEYKRYGMWPSLIPHDNIYGCIGRRIGNLKVQSSTIRLMKNNTNTMYGFLSLYRHTNSDDVKQHIMDWIDIVMEYMVDEHGAPYNMATITKSKLVPFECNLTVGFTLIDLFCDCAYFLGQTECLQHAKKIANYWLRHQGAIGLFPLYPGKTDSYLDSETDMIVALYKLAELSGDDLYSVAAYRAFQGLLDYHKGDNGYYLQVDINSGAVTNLMYKTKFIALMLKAFILYSENTSIYENEAMYNLLRDR